MGATLRHGPGGINSRDLAARAALRNTRAAMSEWTHERLAELIHRILRDDLLEVAQDFSPRSNLVEAGLDSLAVTQLMLSIEENTGVWVDESLLTPENLESSETLAACVHEHLGQR
jgi:acyl carrier protein